MLMLRGKKPFLMLIVISIVVLCGACSSDEETEGKHEQDKNKEQTSDADTQKDKDASENRDQELDWKDTLNAPALPKSKSDVVQQPMGELAKLDVKHNEKDKKKAVKYFSKLPTLEEDADETKMDAYWNKMYEAFHRDYPGVKEILKKLQFGSFGSPDIEDDRFQFKEHLNVEIVLDASGSMGAKMDGKSKMEVAKETIRDFASSLPKEAKVSLRVYGQKGTGSQSDKKMSCNSSKLVYDLHSYDSQKLENAMNKFEPAGWTPITLALKKAQKDLSKYPAKKNTNIIYLVGDGINTCGGDPVKTAKKLSKSNVKPILNIIGFDIDKKGQKQLKEIANSADGMYTKANDADQLKNELDQAETIAKKWAKWKDTAERKARSKQGDIKMDIYHYILRWNDIRTKESKNYKHTLNALKDKGYISRSAYYYLSHKRGDWFRKLGDYKSDITDQLSNLNDQNYQEAKKSIQKAYEENTD